MESGKNINYFDKLAEFYDEYKQKRILYLDSVDNIVIDAIYRLKANSLLDIGSGDGARSINIAMKTGIKNLHLVDPSTEMMKNCLQLIEFSPGFNVKSHVISVLELDIKDKFDVIISLWNVLGHIEENKRVLALKIMADRLNESGSIFLDVNNRYNIKAYHLYGLIHILKDLFKRNNSSGDVSYKLNINDETIEGCGHLFSPREIESIINGAGLKVTKRLIIDYSTGKQKKFVIQGQLFYEIKKKQ